MGKSLSLVVGMVLVISGISNQVVAAQKPGDLAGRIVATISKGTIHKTNTRPLKTALNQPKFMRQVCHSLPPPKSNVSECKNSSFSLKNELQGMVNVIALCHDNNNCSTNMYNEDRSMLYYYLKPSI